MKGSEVSGSKRKRVKVWVRTRPTNNFAAGILELHRDGRSVSIHTSKKDGRKPALQGAVNNQLQDWSFKIDGILHNVNQDEVYEATAADIVSASLYGYNGTIMCYGQTGAGKTFTMTGATESYEHRGIIPHALSQLYREIEERASDYSINVRVSFLEIYNETMIDLLSNFNEMQNNVPQNPLIISEEPRGVYVKGLSIHHAATEEEALNLLFEGETNRSIAEHSLNKQSSRSHCIFSLIIESRPRLASDARYTLSKLNFVDLAGSERLSKTKSEGRTQQEAMYINKSLTFLEQTVMALADKSRDFIPYRQTKLTHFLKDSLGGGCNTLLIANIWAEAAQIEETTSTLRFASRMMCVTQEPLLNEQFDPVLHIKKLESEVESLKQELAMQDTLQNRSGTSYEPLSQQQRADISVLVQKYVRGEIQQLPITSLRQVEGIYESFRMLHNTFVNQTGYFMDKGDAAFDSTINQQLPTSANQSETNSKIGSRSRRRRHQDNQGTEMTRSKGSISDEPRADTLETFDVNDTSTAMEQRPITPPSRNEAFDQFKQDLGSEINRILLENKDILNEKKTAYTNLAKSVNNCKLEIDECKSHLDEMKVQRESEGALTNKDGDTVITEEEFNEIAKLKELKSTYRADFESLKTLKMQVQYCQKLVDQCRQKLIQEFDAWYAETFLQGETTVDNDQDETEEEMFERVRRNMAAADPNAAAYQQAQMKTQRRQVAAGRKAPGTPVRSLRRNPPGVLDVHY